MSDIARERGAQWSLRRPLIGMFVLATVVAGGWLLWESVLRGAADIWIVSDPVSRADAIVVLGGGLETRPFIAAQMWRRGALDFKLGAGSGGSLRSYHSDGREIDNLR